MIISEAKKHLSILLEDRTPIMLLGMPGIGKSSIVKQIAVEKKWKLIDLRLSLLNPIDLRGLPYLDNVKNEAVWLKPAFLPTEGEGILFLDEMNIAPVSTQQAAYQLLLDRQIGEYKFPDGWRIVAAGNREEDQASVINMPAPLTNRLILLDVEAKFDDWAKWASKNVDRRVIEFLKFKPKMLATLPKKEEKSFASPRSWEVVSQILSRYEKAFEGAEADIYAIVRPIIIGAVGEGSATEFISFARKFNLMPDLDGILTGKVTVIPKEADIKHAVVNSLIERLDDKYLDNFLKYIFSMDSEFAMMAVKEASQKGWRAKIEKNNLYVDWSEKMYDMVK